MFTKLSKECIKKEEGEGEGEGEVRPSLLIDRPLEPDASSSVRVRVGPREVSGWGWGFVGCEVLGWECVLRTCGPCDDDCLGVDGVMGCDCVACAGWIWP